MGTVDEVPKFGLDIRKEFMLRENITFLNHGSYGSVPRCVHERQVRYLEEMESHADEWFRFKLYKYLPPAVAKVADFMGIKAEDTFLLQNVTKAVNTVLKTYPLQSGGAYLINTLTYGAVKVTARATTGRIEGAKTYMLDMNFPIEDEDDIVKLYDRFLTDHPDVKLAVIDHITSPTCVLMPVKKLAEVLHRHNVIVVVDAAHAPGQLNFDIQESDADFYTGNMHKWVFCPRSCAFLWMNPHRKHSWFKPLVTSAFDDDGLHTAFAYEGTKDDTPYLCTTDGIDYYNRIGGRDVILNYTTDLKRRGVAYLEEKWGTRRLEVPESMVAPNLQIIHLPHIRGYTDVLKNNLVLQKLIVDRFDIQVKIMPVQGQMVVRVSVQVYNTMDDFVKLADAILELTQEK